MRFKTVILLLIPAALLAGDTDKKSAPAPASAQSKADPSRAPLTLPPDAKRTAPYTYTWTDPHGKKWIYRQTPFGLVRLEDKPAPAAVETQPHVTEIQAVEDGDVVHFERESPFGKQKWTKRKSDLTADESAALERQKQQKSETAARTGR